MIEIRVVEALAHQQRGDLTGALASLERALSLAEPEGYVRTFLDEGAPMAALLTAAADRGSASPYVRRLRAALGVTPDRTDGPGDLVEPLSSRERDVLRLLGTDLNGPEIARELVVSLNTVRTHTKNLYMKLGVNNRRAALRRAQRARPAVAVRTSSPTVGPRAAEFTTSFTTCGEACSPHRLLTSGS